MSALIPTHARRVPWGALFETRDFFGFLKNLEGRYGEAVRVRIVHQWVYLLSGPAFADAFLTTAQSDFGKDTPGFKAMRKVLGFGLITSDGDHWKKQRRTLQPAFKKDGITALGATMDRISASAVEEAVGRGEPLDLFSFMSDVALRIVAETLLSVDVTAEASHVRTDLTTLMREATARTLHPSWLPDWAPTQSNRAFQAARLRLRTMVEGIVAARLAGGPARPDVLQAIVASRDPETGEPMAHEQICDEVITLFLAGHETQAVALTWTAALLETHPSARDQLVHGLTPAALDGVLCESMRLFPPVWLVGRRALRQTEVSGIPIPEGAIVLVSPYVIHRSARVFSHPEEFLPERWAKGPKLQRGAFLPFSLGPRKCIGDHFAMMAMRSVLKALYGAARVEFSAPPDYGFEAGITLRPRVPMTVRFTRRDQRHD